MIDNRIYLINCAKTLSVHCLLQAHKLGSYLVSTGTTIGWSTVHHLECHCYSRAFCIAFPELIRWLVYYPFLTFTTSILCNLTNTTGMTLLKVDNITQLRSDYTECPRRNVPNFGRVFLRLKYTDITQNTYIQS